MIQILQGIDRLQICMIYYYCSSSCWPVGVVCNLHDLGHTFHTYHYYCYMLPGFRIYLYYGYLAIRTHILHNFITAGYKI